jgi:hypothetical protein
MRPIVDGLAKHYAACLSVERINFNGDNDWIARLDPVGTPEFVLLDAAGALRYRWFGTVTPEEFDTIIAPLCS